MTKLVISDLPGQLSNLPISIVIALGSIVVGLLLKKAKFFANKYIPIVVVTLNGFLYWLMTSPGTVHPDIRHPEAVLWLYGVLQGFLAWASHRWVLKYFEKLLPSGFFPSKEWDSNPEAFVKPPAGKD